MSDIEQKLVIYVGPFSFPNGGAAARRILGISQSLVAANYKVVIASGQNECDAPKQDKFKGLDVFSLNERTSEKYPTLLKHILYFGMGKKTIAWLDALKKKPDAIILYSGYSPYFLRLLPWCKKHKVPLIFDAVEWYDPPSFIIGIINPYYWNIELAMRFLSIKAKNIIAISTYLETYYLSKNCNTLRVPPTLDVKNIEARLEVADNDKITLGYTGSPGHKDLLNNILEALLDLDMEGITIKLKVAGITKSQLLEYSALKKRKINKLPRCLESVGIVPQFEAMRLIREVDFSVLLRPNKRYAKAGFPTKFVESFALGTPVIANLTSDLAKYLIDDKTGIVCQDETPESLMQGLERIMQFTPGKICKMRNECRLTAEKYFETEKIVGPLSRFLDEIYP